MYNNKRSFKKNTETNFFNDGSKIPAYNDDSIKNDILKTEKEKRNSLEKEEKRKRKEIINEKKKKLIPMNKLNSLVHLFSILLGIMSIASLIISKNIFSLIYTPIAIILTYMITRRLYGKYDEIDNIVLWNISQSIFDFFRIKLDYYNFFENIERFVNISTIFFIIISLFFSSNSIIYLISLFCIFFSYVIAFSNRNIQLLFESSHKIIVTSIAAILVKTIVQMFVTGRMYIDYSTVIMFNIFFVINYCTSIIEIVEPENDSETLDDNIFDFLENENFKKQEKIDNRINTKQNINKNNTINTNNNSSQNLKEENVTTKNEIQNSPKINNNSTKVNIDSTYEIDDL